MPTSAQLQGRPGDGLQSGPRRELWGLVDLLQHHELVVNLRGGGPRGGGASGAAGGINLADVALQGPPWQLNL